MELKKQLVIIKRIKTDYETNKVVSSKTKSLKNWFTKQQKSENPLNNVDTFLYSRFYIYYGETWDTLYMDLLT